MIVPWNAPSACQVHKLDVIVCRRALPFSQSHTFAVNVFLSAALIPGLNVVGSCGTRTWFYVQPRDSFWAASSASLHHTHMSLGHCAGETRERFRWEERVAPDSSGEDKPRAQAFG